MQDGDTGLPDKLKVGIETLSGLSNDDLRVDRNSDKPDQRQAHADARGADIRLGQGQETPPPCETWHDLQQAQERVRPTAPAGDVVVNQDEALECEAEAMGERVVSSEARGVRLRKVAP